MTLNSLIRAEAKTDAESFILNLTAEILLRQETELAIYAEVKNSFENYPADELIYHDFSEEYAMKIKSSQKISDCNNKIARAQSQYASALIYIATQG